jgi:ribosome-binding protein aMBF1 (putative translation factor)
MRIAVRCVDCDLVQFVTLWGRCRKCRKPYDEPLRLAETHGPKESQTPIPYKAANSEIVRALPYVVRVVRQAQGMSQGQLAGLMGCARQNVNRLECGHKTPNMETFVNLCSALSISQSGFLYLCEHAGP